MASAFAESVAPIEQGPRRALLWGAGLLILGLAAVGVGQADEGAVLALGGLFNIIFGIHSFGRLGPDDRVEAAREAAASPGAAAFAAERAAGVEAMFTGGGWLAAGLIVTLGSYFMSTAPTGAVAQAIACGAVLTGGFRAVRGLLRWQNAGRAQAKVEKKRRLDKSRAP